MKRSRSFQLFPPQAVTTSPALDQPTREIRKPPLLRPRVSWRRRAKVGAAGVVTLLINLLTLNPVNAVSPNLVASRETCSNLTVVMLDVTGSSSNADFTRRRLLAMAKILDRVGVEGSCIAVDKITSTPGRSELIVRPTVLKGIGTNSLMKSRDLTTRKTAALSQVKVALASPAAEQTAFYDALKVGATHCKALVKAPQNCRLVALSDSINTTDPFNVLAVDLTKETIVKIVDDLERTGRTTGMRGIKLYLAGSGATVEGDIEPERLVAISNLNEAFAKRAAMVMVQNDTDLVAFP
jgi:hypothetical protein